MKEEIFVHTSIEKKSVKRITLWEYIDLYVTNLFFVKLTKTCK